MQSAHVNLARISEDAEAFELGEGVGDWNEPDDETEEDNELLQAAEALCSNVDMDEEGGEW